MTAPALLPIKNRNREVADLDLSIVVPVKDEEDSIPILAREIEDSLDRTGLDWECLWIDDGSTDGSLEAMKAIARSHTAHRCLELNHNYGQSASLAIGFRRARGRVIATLDADLQNDPRDIPKLLEHLGTHNLQMVNGVRVNRCDSVVRKFSSRIGNGFRNWVTGESVTDVGCSLRVFHRDCVRHLPLFKGMHRFIPTLIGMHGYRIDEVPVNHRSRAYGETKYGVGNRLWVGIGDTLFVLWYKKRRVDPSIRSESEIGGEPE